MAIKRANPKKVGGAKLSAPRTPKKAASLAASALQGRAGAGVTSSQRAQIISAAKAQLTETNKKTATPMPVRYQPFRAFVREASPLERVLVERQGVSFRIVKEMIDEAGLSATEFRRVVGNMPKATFTKKMKDKAQFAGATGQAVVGLIDLINMVEDMLAADPENEAAQGFDVQKWVGNWIQRPQPALGGLAPAELMDTPTGRESVMRVLGAIQSGAYQ